MEPENHWLVEENHLPGGHSPDVSFWESKTPSQRVQRVCSRGKTNSALVNQVMFSTAGGGGVDCAVQQEIEERASTAIGPRRIGSSSHPRKLFGLRWSRDKRA